MTNSNDNQLSLLIDKLSDGSISKAEFLSLKEMLSDDPSALEQYVSTFEMDSLLSEHFAVEHDQLVALPAPAVAEQHQESSRRWWTVALVATLLVGSGMFVYSNTYEPEGTALTQNIPLSPTVRHSVKKFVRTVARMTNGADAEWVGSNTADVGSWLTPGKFELSKGSIEVTFDSGTVVSIASPSRFEIVGVDEIRLASGSLSADVPEQAIGFRVNTPSGEIVDLSTKFAVDVAPDGGSNVHVVEGLVEVKPHLAGTIPIFEKSSLRMVPDGSPENVDYSPLAIEDFESRKNEKKLSYMHFSFDEIEGDVVSNSGTDGAEHNGKILAGEEKSWFQVAGKVGKAIFFTGKSARVESKLKGISGNQPRTVAFWVRIMSNTNPRNCNSFVGLGAQDNLSGGMWQIGWNPNQRGPEGTFGGIRTEFGDGHVIGSTDLRDGRWHHIASVFIGGQKNDDVAELVRHYVDGKLESVSGFRNHKILSDSNEITLTMGAPVHDFTEGSYKGWLDEVYLFDSALTPAQISRLMHSNEPPESSEIVPDSDSK